MIDSIHARRRRRAFVPLPRRHEVAGIVYGSAVAYCAARGGLELLGDVLAILHKTLGR